MSRKDDELNMIVSKILAELDRNEKKFKENKNEWHDFIAKRCSHLDDPARARCLKIIDEWINGKLQEIEKMRERCMDLMDACYSGGSQ